MNKIIFPACLFLMLPFCVLAAEQSVSKAELVTYKELSQTRTDALKESLQKDIQTQTVRIESLDKRVERQDKLLDSFSVRISDLSLFLTVFGLVAGLMGYFTVSNRAQKEARTAAEAWIKKEGLKAIDEKLKDLDSHITSQKDAATAKREAFDCEIETLRMKAAPQMAEQQNQIRSSPNPKDGSVDTQKLAAYSDAVNELVEALKRKPEAEYGFKDWNARALDAYSKGNYALAAEYWLQAARGGKASGVELVQSMCNAGVSLLKLKRYEETIAVLDSAVSLYGSAPEVLLREEVINALMIKGSALAEMERLDESIAVFDSVVSLYGNASEANLRKHVARAMFNKVLTLGRMGRHEESMAVCDEILSRYGSAPEFEVQEAVAHALVEKGNTLGKLGRYEESITVFDAIVLRYGNEADAKMHDVVGQALNGKGFTLLCRAKEKWNEAAVRMAGLQAAKDLFAQAEKEIIQKYVVWGNQAYIFVLLGDTESARSLMKQAMQQNSEWLYKATLEDMEIHPVPLDADFRAILEEAWAEVKLRALTT